MLVLQRRVGERIHIGDSVIITVNAVRKGRVRLGIEAPRDVRIDRSEIRQRLLAELDVVGILAGATLPTDVSVVSVARIEEEKMTCHETAGVHSRAAEFV